MIRGSLMSVIITMCIMMTRGRLLRASHVGQGSACERVSGRGGSILMYCTYVVSMISTWKCHNLAWPQGIVSLTVTVYMRVSPNGSIIGHTLLLSARVVHLYHLSREFSAHTLFAMLLCEAKKQRSRICTVDVEQMHLRLRKVLAAIVV